MRLGESYFRVISFFLSLRFLHRCLIVWGRIFGSSWGALGNPNRSFWASTFYRFLCVVPRAVQERPRAAQERPRAAQERPRAAKSGQKRPKSGPRAAQERPKAANERQRERTSNFCGPSKGFSNNKSCQKITCATTYQNIFDNEKRRVNAAFRSQLSQV